MTVIVVAACPVGLRGHLTRWLLEISPGVFVGKVTARVRTLMWIRVLDMVSTGRAIMVHSADNEQGLSFQVHDHNLETGRLRRDHADAEPCDRYRERRRTIRATAARMEHRQ